MIRSCPNRAGFSLAELVIALTVLAGLLTTLGFAALKAQTAHDVASVRSQLDQQAHRTLDRIVALLDDAGRESFDPRPVSPDHTSSMSFQCPDGWDGAVVWGLPQRLELRMETGELDNGRDDDSDGVIDECVIAWTENPGEDDQREAQLARWVRELAEGETWNGLDDNGNGLVDERGFSLDVTGNVLHVLVTLEKPDGRGGSVLATAETSVRIRN